jgi:kynurenine formamidase
VLPSQRRDSTSWGEIFAELQDALRLDAVTIDSTHIDPAASDDAAPARAREINQAEYWLAPIRMEPMTEDEAAHARSLLSAQLIAIEALERRKKSTGRHLAVVRSLPGTRTTDGPVYLDISG